MAQATTVDQPAARRRGVLEVAREAANPATVQGSLAVLGGVLVLGLPGVSIVALELVLGIVLLLAGVVGLWYGLTGRGRAIGRSRLRAVFRGVGSILMAALILLAPTPGTSLLIWFVGLYLFFRGVAMLVRAALSRRRALRAARFAAGSAMAAFGAFAVLAPAELSNGLVLAGAVAAVLIGGIVLAYGIRVAGAPEHVDLADATLTVIIWDWVHNADLGAERRETLARTLYFEPPGRAGKLVAWWVMLLLSVAIATFAVLADSTAVVIGAMLVAPLMTPILGLAGAVVNGWTHRAVSSSWLVLLGATVAIVQSFLIARWVPTFVTLSENSQVTSRVDPTLIDLLIAVCAGAAGAFATVNSRVASSIAGVAIAVALVPPLSVVGTTLAAGQTANAFGALLLFTTNFVAIVLSAALVFVLGGFADVTVLQRRSRQLLLTLAPFGALALVVMVPLVFTSEGIIATATQQREATQTVREWLGGDPDLRLVKVTVDDDRVSVEITGSSDPPPVEDLQRALADQRGSPTSLSLLYTPSEVTIVTKDGEELP
jgi:uncharacterized hydrophobic protein (TIGR00271 family)